MISISEPSGRRDAASSPPEQFEVMLVSGSDEPGYSVFVPALPGCASQGEDWDEALYMVQDAIELFLETLPRPEVDAAEEKHRIVRDWTPQGYLVESAKVWVNP